MSYPWTWMPPPAGDIVPSPDPSVAQLPPEHAAQRMFYTTLSSLAPLTSLLGAPGNLYGGIAPQDTTYPYVVWFFIPGREPDLFGDGTVASWTMEFQVRVVVEGQNEDKASRIYFLVMNALHNLRVNDQDGYRMNCLRIGGLVNPQFVDRHYRQAGGRYLVTARPAITLET